MYSSARSRMSLSGGIELNAFAVALRTHVGQAFCLARVDRDIIFAGVFADDHADVNLVARLDHQTAAFLHHVERVGGGFAAFHADERAVFARGNFAAVRAVFVEEMAHHAHAAWSELTRSVSKPIKPRIGMSASMLTWLPMMVHVRDLALCGRQDFP